LEDEKCIQNLAVKSERKKPLDRHGGKRQVNNVNASLKAIKCEVVDGTGLMTPNAYVNIAALDLYFSGERKVVLMTLDIGK
jgi:hypothetical protein